ncbi:MAG: hypothetical protein INQ03_06750 [Candidatus Heimdallarchaeota archaeon]|nr:hypothetical protein [Candidatus Heimdallarchaeota archaeon]
MIELSKEKVKEYLRKVVEEPIDLHDFTYLLQDTAQLKIITIANPDLKEVQPKNMVLKGIPIVLITTTGCTLLPPLLNCIRDVETVQISRKEAVEISYHRPISKIVSNSIVLLEDTSGRRVGLARQIKNQLVPIIDLGFFLREEGMVIL